MKYYLVHDKHDAYKMFILQFECCGFNGHQDWKENPRVKYVPSELKKEKHLSLVHSPKGGKSSPKLLPRSKWHRERRGQGEGLHGEAGNRQQGPHGTRRHEREKLKLPLISLHFVHCSDWLLRKAGGAHRQQLVEDPPLCRDCCHCHGKLKCSIEELW